MFLDFVKRKEEKFKILDSYFITNGNQHGIFFLLLDKREQVKEFFLPKELINGDFIPYKCKDKEDKARNVQYKALGVSVGDKHEVIVQTGEWVTQNWLGKQKKVGGKIYRVLYEK